MFWDKLRKWIFNSGLRFGFASGIKCIIVKCVRIVIRNDVGWVISETFNCGKSITLGRHRKFNWMDMISSQTNSKRVNVKRYNVLYWQKHSICSIWLRIRSILVGCLSALPRAVASLPDCLDSWIKYEFIIGFVEMYFSSHLRELVKCNQL